MYYPGTLWESSWLTFPVRGNQSGCCAERVEKSCAIVELLAEIGRHSFLKTYGLLHSSDQNFLKLIVVGV